MTELEQYQPRGNGQVSTWPASQQRATANNSVVALGQWAEAAKAAHEVSEVLVRTPFVPEPYRDNPYAATAAILAGGEVGLNPMASLGAFDVIQGRAAAKAITLRAIVQSVGHEIWVEESTDARAVVRGRRAGSSKVEESIWTIQRARTMKLTTKQQWQLQPTAMLLARATSECARMVAADAILGIPYSAEELGDEGPDTAAEQAPVPQRTAKRAPRRPAADPPAAVEAAPDEPAADPTSPTAARAAAPRNAAPATATPAADQRPPLPGEPGHDSPAEPSPAEDDEPDPEPPDDVDRASTQAQNRLMHALFREAEVTDRDSRLYLTGLLLNRELDTSKGLTVADAKAVIDAMENLKASGHDEGLVGAVNDLINVAEQIRIEAEESGQTDGAGGDDEGQDDGDGADS